MATTERARRLEHQREALRAEYSARVHTIKAEDESKELTYINQKEAAMNIIGAFFSEGKVIVTLIAKPMVGKTGTFLETAYQACIHPDDNCIINPSNVFIITGMSDRDWREQTTKDMLYAFRGRVYHRGQLVEKETCDGFWTAIQNARDALIIIDECHIAAQKEQKLSKMLKELKIFDVENLRKKNIKLLIVSATPAASAKDAEAWGTVNHSTVILKEDPRVYVGFRQMIDEGRLHPSYDLTKEAEMDKLIQFVATKFPQPCWNVIRLPAKCRTNSTMIDKFTLKCDAKGWRVSAHNATDRMGEIDHHMKKRPPQHTFLIIKEFWRASKRLIDTYVGIVHEPTTKNTDDNVMAQGLIARLGGNNKRRGPTAPHAFGDVESIKRYLSWFDTHGCDFNRVKLYKSRSLTVKDGQVTSSKESFAHVSNLTNLTQPNTDSQENPEPEFEFIFAEFTSLSQNDAWAKENCGAERNTRYNHSTEPGKEAFFICSSSFTGIHSYADLYQHHTEAKQGGLDKNPEALYDGEVAYRRYVCYKDMSDPTSVCYVTRAVRRLRGRPRRLEQQTLNLIINSAASP